MTLQIILWSATIGIGIAVIGFLLYYISDEQTRRREIIDTIKARGKTTLTLEPQLMDMHEATQLELDKMAAYPGLKKALAKRKAAGITGPLKVRSPEMPASAPKRKMSETVGRESNDLSQQLFEERQKQVSVFSENEIPIFSQGAPCMELEELVTAEYCAGISQRITELMKPINMILFCPSCKRQHIDKAEDLGEYALRMQNIVTPQPPPWENPPHRSHKCTNCHTVWRPADVCTNGVNYIQTQGKADTWLFSEHSKRVVWP